MSFNEGLKIKENDIHYSSENDDELFQDNKYLTFCLSDEIYGIDISNVREIIEIQKITAVPDMPEYFKGIINLRGKVIPIIDLRLRFKMNEKKYDDRTCIVIVSINENLIGLIVDTVLEVVDIPETDIDDPPQFNIEDQENFIIGIGKVGGNVKLLLDVEKIIIQRDLNKIK